jgi:hypothetical protein
MWEKPHLNYQEPISERFDLVTYGCCEERTGRISDVL